jgi:hypothetical protein
MLKEERDYKIRPEKGNTKTKVSPRSLIKTQIWRPKTSVKENNSIPLRAKVRERPHPVEISSGDVPSLVF